MYGEIPGTLRAPQVGQTEAPPKMSQVQEQMERAANITEKLLDRVNLLHSRLGPVLRTAPEGKGQSEAKPTLVGHAMALSNHNDQIGMACACVDDILERLEL
jgi:hypothetical protein